MVTAVFDKSTKYVTAERLWQWDYGQILRIQGLQLPQAVEIHFSKTENSGDSVTRIGVTKNGVTEVLIPDSMLESTGDIYAFVYLRSEHTGETEYKVMIPLKERPRPEIPGTSEEGGIFEDVVQAVRESADQAAESARQAGLIKDSVQDMVDTIGSIDEQVQAVKEYSEKAETASSNAAVSESRAKESETAAEAAKTSAVQSAESARQSATAVERVGQQVSEHKTAVEQAVGGFDKKVSEASTAIERAKTGAVKAVEDKGNEVLQSIPQDFETQMAGKLDKHQGTENAGKALVVGEDGNVVPGEVQSGGGDGIAIINTMSGASPLVILDSAERVNKGFVLIGNTEQSQDPPPSPDNPQPIKSVGRWNEAKQKYEIDVRVTGKNIIDDRIENWQQGGYSPTGEYENINYRICLKNLIKVNNTKQILFDTGNNDYTFVVRLYDKHRKFVRSIGSITNNKPVTLLSEEYIGVSIQNNKGTEMNLSEFNDMHVFACYFALNNSYSKYTEQTLTLTSDRPITKWDKLVEQEGQIGWLYGSNTVIFDGSEDEKWNKMSTEAPTFSIDIANCKFADSLCDRYIYKSSAWVRKEFGVYGDNGYNTKYFRPPHDGFSIDEYAWKEFLKTYPLTIKCRSIQTEFIPLPQPEQDAIRALITYYPTTVVTADGGEVIPSVELTYTADTKNYILNREKITQEQIANIQAALISQKISGGGIKVTDSSNLPVEGFMMSGKTEQVSTEGKNLIDIPKIVLGPDWRIDGDKLYCDKPSLAYRTSEIMIPLKEVTTYYFSALIKTDNNSIHVSVDLLDADKEPLVKNVIIFENGNREKSFTTKPEHAYCKVYFRNRTINEGGSIESIMLSTVKGIAYEPYTGGKPSPSPDFPQPIEVTPQGIITVDFTDGTNHQTVELNCPREFTKWDKLEKIDGVWNWVFQSRMDTDIKPSRADLFVVDPILYKSYGNGLYCYTWGIIKKSIGWQTSLCTQFKNIDNSYGKGEKAWTYSDQPSLRSQYFVTTHKTVDEFKEWVEANPLTMWYKTEISEHVPLPQPEQDKLNALTMYSPNTEITNTGGCNMELTYTVDTKSYVDSKIAALSKAML